MKRIISFFIWCLLLLNSFVSELYGFSLVPRVSNFSVREYKAGNQNWSITQDKEGCIYVGNNKGVLEFDGIHWKLYPLPNNNIIRCVYYSSDEKLYVGSYEEFGFFERDEYNQLQYTSLKELLTDYQFNNEEIWNIFEHDEKVYFQYFTVCFEYDGSALKVHNDFTPLNMFIYRDQVFSQKINGGLFTFDSGRFNEVLNRDLYGNNDIIGIVPNKQNSLLVTRNKGIFMLSHRDSVIIEWDNSINEELKTSSVNKVLLTKDSCYIIGTLSNGVYALNHNGELLWKINNENGLINNTILGLFCDEENNIWVGLDNGLAKIYHNSELFIFNPTSYHIGMVYDVLRRGEGSYIASNQGVYYYNEKTEVMKIVPGTEGQAWSLSDIDGQIVCGHNTGTFIINEESITSLSSIKGGRGMKKCNIHNQSILLENTYTFLNVYRRKNNGELYYSNRIENFMDLIENIEVDYLSNIWAEHMHRGFYKIQLDETLSKTKNIKYYNGLGGKQNTKINILKINDRIVFSTGEEFYTYEDIKDTIIPYEKLNNELSDLKNAYKVIAKNSTKYWFVDHKYYSLVEFENNSYHIKKKIPFSAFDNPPIENKGNVFIKPDKETLFALNGSLAKYIEKKVAPATILPVLKLKEVMVSNGSGENTFIPTNNSTTHLIPYHNNNICIRLYCPVFRDRPVHLRYKLDGLDEKSVWSHGEHNIFEKEYSRLPFGEYVFKAELFDNNGTVSAIQYPFIIMKPFYLSNLAIAIYIITGLLLILLVVYIVHNYTNKKKTKQAKEQRLLHEAKIERQQKHIAELEKEQLMSELSYKSKELSNFTMTSIKNREFLIHIKEKLQHQLNKGPYSRPFLSSLIRIIDDSISSDDYWKVLMSNFDRIHENFFRNLKIRYPNLTPNDLRLCALLRLNLSTKDISNMMNLSVRGTEAARYRLRKKLDLHEGESLVDFIMKFK